MSPRIMRVFFMTAVLIGAEPGWAEQGKVPALPPEGSTEYTTYYVAEPIERLDWGEVGVSGTGVSTGITRNDEGQPFFDGMSVNCVNQWAAIGDTFTVSGACTETDRDGDQVFSTFDDKSHYIVGGSGKYNGIKGTAAYTEEVLPRPAEGVVAAIVSHEVSWRIEQ